MPITVAPRWFAHWQAIRPTPPAAAWIRQTVPLLHLVGAVNQVLHGHALEHHAGGLLVADIVGQLHRAIGVEHALGRIAAERSDIGDAVADFEVGHAGADRDHLAGALVAGDERHATARDSCRCGNSSR